MRTNGGKRGEHRSSALWGTGNRGGETRSNVLWGKGGRGFVTALVAMLVIAVPLASSAGQGKKLRAVAFSPKRTWVSPGLLRGAKRHPNKLVRVIIQSTNGDLSAAVGAFNRADRQDAANDPESMKRTLGVVDGVAVKIRARKLAMLMKDKNLIITPDVPVKVSAYRSTQLWPFESGASRAWNGYDALAPGSAPTIAVVDSGVQPGRADFGWRLLANVNLSTLPNNSAGDGRGHGTFVAGIAAGAADGYAGTTPQANLVSLDVMDDTGTARTSDVIAACQWLLANKDRYNIRIANFSLHSAMKSNFYRDPLDQAVEKLWFGGVVVVAAAGNYGTGNTPSGVPYAPGNDPFVITVGAADLGGTLWRNDDTAAPWSAYGRTLDGFMKPDVVAPGRYMVGPVPSNSTLASERADKLVAPGYIQLSGTSFAAPVVAGAAAQILAKHPSYTPDQVKGALMETAHAAPGCSPGLGRRRRGSGQQGLAREPAAEPEQGSGCLRQDGCRLQRPRLRRGQLDRRGQVERLLGRRLVGRRLLERRGVERGLLGRRVLGGCLLGRRVLGGCLLGRRLLATTSPGRTRPKATPAPSRAPTSSGRARRTR